MDKVGSDIFIINTKNLNSGRYHIVFSSSEAKFKGFKKFTEKIVYATSQIAKSINIRFFVTWYGQGDEGIEFSSRKEERYAAEDKDFISKYIKTIAKVTDVFINKFTGKEHSKQQAKKVANSLMELATEEGSIEDAFSLAAEFKYLDESFKSKLFEKIIDKFKNDAAKLEEIFNFLKDFAKGEALQVNCYLLLAKAYVKENFSKVVEIVKIVEGIKTKSDKRIKTKSDKWIKTKSDGKIQIELLKLFPEGVKKDRKVTSAAIKIAASIDDSEEMRKLVASLIMAKKGIFFLERFFKTENGIGLIRENAKCFFLEATKKCGSKEDFLDAPTELNRLELYLGQYEVAIDEALSSLDRENLQGLLESIIAGTKREKTTLLLPIFHLFSFYGIDMNFIFGKMTDKLFESAARESENCNKYRIFMEKLFVSQLKSGNYENALKIFSFVKDSDVFAKLLSSLDSEEFLGFLKVLKEKKIDLSWSCSMALSSKFLSIYETIKCENKKRMGLDFFVENIEAESKFEMLTRGWLHPVLYVEYALENHINWGHKNLSIFREWSSSYIFSEFDVKYVLERLEKVSSLKTPPHAYVRCIFNKFKESINALKISDEKKTEFLTRLEKLIVDKSEEPKNIIPKKPVKATKVKPDKTVKSSIIEKTNKVETVVDKPVTKTNPIINENLKKLTTIEKTKKVSKPVLECLVGFLAVTSLYLSPTLGLSSIAVVYFGSSIGITLPLIYQILLPSSALIIPAVIGYLFLICHRVLRDKREGNKPKEVA